jgi:hypothetical protein
MSEGVCIKYRSRLLLEKDVVTCYAGYCRVEVNPKNETASLVGVDIKVRDFFGRS